MAIIYYNSVLTILSKVLLLNFEGEKFSRVKLIIN